MPTDCRSADDRGPVKIGKEIHAKGTAARTTTATLQKTQDALIARIQLAGEATSKRDDGKCRRISGIWDVVLTTSMRQLRSAVGGWQYR